MNQSENREIYLIRAVSLMSDHFTLKNYTIPPLRVSCGWPHSGGTRAKKRVLGQAWSQDAASDGIIQIFISPFLSDPVAEYGVLSVLLHELCHAVVGNKEKHNKVFGKCARSVGLTGKMTSTVPTPELQPVIAGWSNTLGVYPNASLDLSKSPTKKQSVRMIKMECETCGYVARTTRKWLESAGPCHCPKHGEMKYELPTTEGDDEEDSADSE